MKKKRYRIHKRFYVFVALLVILIAALCVHFLGGGNLSGKNKAASTGKAQKTQSETVKKGGSNETAEKTESAEPPAVSGIKTMPASYENTAPAKQQGSLHEITYTVKINGVTYKRPALVYLPAGYTSSKKYNVFYLMHGYGGTYHTYLGWTTGPRPFKNILDHMIADGKIKPTIVVGVEYNSVYGNYYYGQLDTVSKEIVQNLAPYVESKYSTYASSTSEEGLTASRAHRAIGGFSMGGCATWRALKNYADVFQYYLPMSMPMYYYGSSGGYEQAQSQSSAKEIAAGVKKKAAGKRVYVFAATGGADMMNQGTEMQAKDLSKQSGFTWVDPTSDFSKGNITFCSWQGHTHSYMQTYPYLYNGLMRFFG